MQLPRRKPETTVHDLTYCFLPHKIIISGHTSDCYDFNTFFIKFQHYLHFHILFDKIVYYFQLIISLFFWDFWRDSSKMFSRIFLFYLILHQKRCSVVQPDPRTSFSLYYPYVQAYRYQSLKGYFSSSITSFPADTSINTLSGSAFFIASSNSHRLWI